MPSAARLTWAVPPGGADRFLLWVRHPVTGAVSCICLSWQISSRTIAPLFFIIVFASLWLCLFLHRGGVLGRQTSARSHSGCVSARGPVVARVIDMGAGHRREAGRRPAGTRAAVSARGRSATPTTSDPLRDAPGTTQTCGEITVVPFLGAVSSGAGPEPGAGAAAGKLGRGRSV